ALGNHEFDNGPEGLIDPFLKNVTCKVLSANIHPDATLASKISGYYLPYVILNVDSEKVAIVGYTSKETPALSQPGKRTRFEDGLEEVQTDPLSITAVNLSSVFGLSPLGNEEALKINNKKKDKMTFIVFPFFVFKGQPPSKEVPAGSYPFMVDSDDGRKVPVVQAYAFGKYLGYLKVSFDDKGNVLKSYGNPILLNSSIPEDTNVRAEVDRWKKALANYSSQIIGETLVYLNGTFEECRFRECNLGNFICDAMVNHNIRYPSELQWNHVSACILNGGGIRSPIDERTRNGSITMEDLISVLPFGSTFDLVELKGSTLRKAFEHAVRRYGGNTGEFLQVSGIHIEFDLSRQSLDRVTDIQILCTSCRVPKYEPLDSDKSYKLVIPSYLVEGGDGFTMIRDEKLKHDSGKFISVNNQAIKMLKKTHPPSCPHAQSHTTTKKKQCCHFLSWEIIFCLEFHYFIL
uniref:5'-nucleotidase n=1 Tax=Lepisosteus oculatus TaxID=7918 RepID=W5NJV3_LEPOC